MLVRDEDRTVITMANDFQGEVRDFAVVIPVPTFIERGQINVADMALIDHLDAYTAPRLVEYHDPDPCQRYRRMEELSSAPVPMAQAAADKAGAGRRGVTIEASYTVGEYDILILSAEDSGGLVAWLDENGYRLPRGAQPVIRSYLRQDMRFFVARVNIEEQARLGYTKLRPLQVAYESPRFMLPIRLGTVNAKAAQELFVYALTRTGRVETTNYRTVRLPSDTEVPEYVEDEFGEFYRAMFTHQTDKHNGRAVFLEYAWDMAWCDPCAADPLSPDELRRLGVFWVDAPGRTGGKISPPGAQNVFVTRLHVRYDSRRFPEDLVFHETGDRSNFQGLRCVDVLRRGPRAPGAGSPRPREADRLGSRRDPREDPVRVGRPRNGARALVESAVELGPGGGCRPGEVGSQCLVHGSAVVGSRCACRGIVESVVRRRQPARVEAHQVRHDRPNAALLVVQHDGRAAVGTHAEFKRPAGVLVVERLALQAAGLVDGEIAVPEKDDVRRVLARDSLANRTMADVVVDGIVVGMRVNVIAAPAVLVRHGLDSLRLKTTSGTATTVCGGHRRQRV